MTPPETGAVEDTEKLPRRRRRERLHLVKASDVASSDESETPRRVPFHQRDLPVPTPRPTKDELKGSVVYLRAAGKAHLSVGHRHTWAVLKLAWRGAGVVGPAWLKLAQQKEAKAFAREAEKRGDRKAHSNHQANVKRGQAGAWVVAVVAAVVLLAPATWLAAEGVSWGAVRPLVLTCLAWGAAVAALAVVGRRTGKPLPPVTPAPTVAVTPDRVLAAFAAASFKNAALVGGARVEGKGVHRRMRVTIDLDPDGSDTATAVIKKREVVAARLQRDLPCVHLSRGVHPGQVELTLLDQDPMAAGDIPSPLLEATETDMWDPIEIGRDILGNVVRLPLLWTSLLVGAQPRMGKTYAMRLLCLAIALDRRSRLYLWDGKGGGDYRWFKPLAARFGQGHSASKGHPAACLKMLREISALVSDRNERIGQLPTHLIPEGKLSRQVARDAQYDAALGGFAGLVFVVVDELQRLIADPEHGEDIRDELIALAQNAPSAGVILIVGTQRPTQTTGKGSLGDLPPAMGSRVAFKTMDAGESNVILGDGYAGAGWDSSKFDHGYEGVSILRSGADVETGPKGCQLVKWGRIDNGPLESKLEALAAERSGAPVVALVKSEPAAEARSRLLEVFEPDEDRLPLSGVALRLDVELAEARRLVAQAGGKVTTIRFDGGTPEGVKRASLGVA